MGAKNMVVDGHGGKFHQYDLSVDGLSYFSMPAMFELGTENMWRKIDKWGMVRSESRASGDNCPSDEDLQKDQLRDAYTQSMTETYNRWNAMHDTGNGKERTGRLVDEYHFDKAKSKQSRSYGRSISGGEVKAMIPKNESEEDRMLRIAMEASMRDLDKNNFVSHSSSSSNGRIQPKSSSARQVRSEHNTHLVAVGENEDLIDFGEDSVHDLSSGVSQISFSHQMPSDVSVMGDDDVTVASFMAPMQQPSVFGMQQPQQQPQQQPFYPSNNQPYQQQLYQQQPAFQDPTFNIPTQTTPRNGGVNDDMSFAYAPPPTWDDYKDAFGGSVRMAPSVVGGGGSVVMGNSMTSPVSASSPMNMNGSAMFAPQQHFQQQQSYNGYSGNVTASNPFASPNNQQQNHQPKTSMFDPLKNDPFA